MRTMRHFCLALIVAVAGLFAQAAPGSAQAWPQRTVRVIVPLPAGSAVDVSARLFAERLADAWKQPVIVENIPGADGVLAAKEFVGRRDDHTLLYSFAGLITINPLLYEKLPYQPVDFAPIATTSDNFLAVAVSAKLPVRSLDELVAHARTRSAKLNWAATAGLPYFAFAGFLKRVGVDMVYVPYRDFNPALTDAGEGRIDVVSTALTQMLPHEKAGSLRFLAVINRTRSPLAPSVQTAIEAGHPDLVFDGVTGFFGMRGMPDALRDRVAAEVRAIADEPRIRQRLAEIGIAARGGTTAEFVAAIEEQRVKVAAIAAAVGARPAQ
jgi:tripartite-type tricarboxylate transporter receptor subunit TctC